MASNLPPNDEKPWYQSKTVIFNIIVALLALVLYVLDGITAGEVQIPGGIDAEWVIFAQGIINLVLRFVTTKALRF